MSDSTLYIGYAAAVLGTVCWLPQTFKTLRTRSVDDLSLPTNLILLMAILLWLTYGLLRLDMPLILANLFSSFCVGSIVVAKLVWARAPATSAPPAPVPASDEA
ncbi:MAG: SemiSWEET family sugar transporter [Pararhodobacter sp.]